MELIKSVVRRVLGRREDREVAKADLLGEQWSFIRKSELSGKWKIYD